MRREERLENDQEEVEETFLAIAAAHIDTQELTGGVDALTLQIRDENALTTVCARDIVKRSEEVARKLHANKDVRLCVCVLKVRVRSFDRFLISCPPSSLLSVFVAIQHTHTHTPHTASRSTAHHASRGGGDGV